MLELKELSSPLIGDVSFMSPQVSNDTTQNTQRQNIIGATEEMKKPAAAAAGRKLLKGKRLVPESPLVRGNGMKTTRSKQTDLWTPLHTKATNKRQQQLVTPLITPKFDPSKPVTAAREPKRGETLVSLAGSPVVKAQADQGNDAHLVSISMLPQSTVLGGSLFLDEGMSPNTLIKKKQIIEEAVAAINTRLEMLNSQVTASGSSSNLNMS